MPSYKSLAIFSYIKFMKNFADQKFSLFGISIAVRIAKLCNLMFYSFEIASRYQDVKITDIV